MMRRVSVHLVDAIWRALREGPRSTRRNALPIFLDRCGGDDAVPVYVVDDLLHDLGFGDIANVPDALRALDVETETLFSRPSGRAQMSIGGAYVRPVEVAALLIRLERLGVDVDPEALVGALRPALAAKSRLTRAEIDIWWHDKERHRSQPVTLVADEDGVVGAAEVRTSAGYRAEAWLAADGRAVQLWVRAPRYQRRRAA